MMSLRMPNMLWLLGYFVFVGGSAYAAHADATIATPTPPHNHLLWNFSFPSGMGGTGSIYLGDSIVIMQLYNASVSGGDYTYIVVDQTSGQELCGFTEPQYYYNFLSSNSMIYNVLNETNMIALESRSGLEVWSFFQEQGAFSSTTTLSPASETIFTVTANSSMSRLYALNATSGAELWSKRVMDYAYYSYHVASTRQYLFGQGVVALLSVANEVYAEIDAFDPSSGEHLWALTFQQAPWNVLIDSGVVLCGFEPTDNVTLYAGFDALGGDFLWNVSVSDVNFASIYAADGVVYFARITLDAFVHVEARNVSTGAQLWSAAVLTLTYPAQDPSFGMKVVNGILYCFSSWPFVVAIHPATGKSLWNHNPPRLNCYSDSVPQMQLHVTQEVVFYRCNGGTVALNTTSGEYLWKWTPGTYNNFFSGVIAFTPTAKWVAAWSFV